MLPAHDHTQNANMLIHKFMLFIFFFFWLPYDFASFLFIFLFVCAGGHLRYTFFGRPQYWLQMLVFTMFDACWGSVECVAISSNPKPYYDSNDLMLMRMGEHCEHEKSG